MASKHGIGGDLWVCKKRLKGSYRNRKGEAGWMEYKGPVSSGEVKVSK